MCYFQLNRRYPRGYKGLAASSAERVKDSRVRVTQSEATALNAKELQRFGSLAKVIQTLFKDI